MFKFFESQWFNSVLPISLPAKLGSWSSVYPAPCTASPVQSIPPSQGTSVPVLASSLSSFVNTYKALGNTT